ncbi:MAG: hypothetical protein L3J65_07310 [Robiginitomaculum sp.]|nr:hypothetical protein [Robiginitomaculum sp.]
MMRMNMRFIACTKLALLSSATVLLSGCSWLGFGGGGQQSHQQGAYQAQSASYNGSQAQYNVQSGRRALGRCQITTPTQRIPQGCRPEQVTLALGGSQAGYGGQAGQYTSGGYGSHVGAAQMAQANYAPQAQVKRPRLRGQFGLEIDHSVGGELYATEITPLVAAYDRPTFEEGSVTGSVADGRTTTVTYTSSPARIGEIYTPKISFDDVYTAPLRVSGGFEYILGDNATVFATAGYTQAEGKKGGSVAINEELLEITTEETFITNAADGVVGTSLGTTSGAIFLPNENAALFDYEFSELVKYDFEVGGRYYFSPILSNTIKRPLTPFVSASGGAAHYNETTVRENQRQRFLGRAFDDTQVSPTGDFYDVSFGTPTQIYDAQWVPYGAVKAGLEWQMTPKTALAFEAGIKYESARDFSDGTKGDDIISVPITIRGSYNF